MASRTPPEIPEVEFHFVGNDNLTPEEREQELKKLLAKRDALLREMGLPPVETHEDCHKSGEDEHASGKLASSPERPIEPESRQAIHRKTSLLDEKQEQMFCSHCGQELKKDYHFCPMCGTQVGATQRLDQPEPPALCHIWFSCPKCGICFERWGQDLSEIKFGSCPRCGYVEPVQP